MYSLDTVTCNNQHLRQGHNVEIEPCLEVETGPDQEEEDDAVDKEEHEAASLPHHDGELE